MSPTISLLRVLVLSIGVGGSELSGDYCSLAGVSPGMDVSHLEDLLGKAEQLRAVDGPRERGSSLVENRREERLWHSKKLEYLVLSDRGGRVLSVTVRSRGDEASGPWGLKIGSDTWRDALSKKIGARYLEPLPVICHEGGEYELAVQASCGAEGSSVLTLRTRIPRSQVTGIDCGTTPSIETLLRISDVAIIEEGTLEF